MSPRTGPQRRGLNPERNDQLIPVLPLHGGHGLRGIHESSLAALPFLGFTLLLLLLAGLAVLYLWRSGRLAVPALGRARLAEHEAQRILAERFARGDITTDEFLERASILNWTPGADAGSARNRRNRT